MKVIVTGAGGFVGLNIIHALKETDHEVHALIRPSTKREYLDQFNVNVHIGNLSEPSSLEESFKGMDAVIHCAAMTSGFKKDRAIVKKTNIQGTRNVVNAAIKNRLKRLVYTSTTSTIGNNNGSPADENVALNGYRSKSQYGMSKLAGEKICHDAIKNDLEVVILNPAEVMGPFDYHFGWGSVILGLKKKEMPIIPQGGGSFCHSFEVGRAHVAALTKGKNGEKYILGGTDISYPEFFKKIVERVDSELPNVNVFNNSYIILKMIFGVKELLYPWTKSMPPLDKTRLKVFYQPLYFSSEKACKELGYKNRSIDEMINDSYEWYLNNGYLQ